MGTFELDSLYIDHAAILKLTRHFAQLEGTCLLYSGSIYETAEHSFLFLFPYDCITIHGKRQYRCNPNQHTIHSVSLSNPWEALQALGFENTIEKSSFPEWVGFFGYEMGAYSDLEINIPHLLASTPEAYWQRCAVVLMTDHRSRKSSVRIVEDEKTSFDAQTQHWINQLTTEKGWQHLIEHLEGNAECQKEVKSQLKLIQVSDNQDSYIKKIKMIQELICAGEFYQLNLSQQLDFKGQIDPFDLFYKLSQANPAPFSVYMKLKDIAIVSSSPERFLLKSNGQLETRPIKGTAPRGKTKEEDEENRLHLLSSEKEKAELLMITDLMRNDLGRVSLPGSVQTPLIWGCEEYTNVFHLHSIIRSKVKPDLSPLDVVRTCFPGGSITGCPKLRAMEEIFSIEQRPRGVYTGSIGYFTGMGDFDLNIAIRTVVVRGEELSLQLGGAIVADSDPFLEYQETMHKGRTIFKMMNIQEVVCV